MNIKELRKKLGMSQQVLSDKTGIPKGRIAQWEAGNGRPKVDDTKKLKNFFIECGLSGEFGDEVDERPGGEMVGKYIKNLEQTNALLQRLVNVSLDKLSSDLHRLLTAQTIARAEVRAFGEYQVMKDARGDDSKRVQIMRQINNLIAANLQVEDEGNNLFDVRN